MIRNNNNNNYKNYKFNYGIKINNINVYMIWINNFGNDKVTV